MEKKLEVMEELTPEPLQCGVGACPAIFKTNRETYALIGKKLDPKEMKVDKRVGKDEVLIEIPKELIDNKR